MASIHGRNDAWFGLTEGNQPRAFPLRSARILHPSPLVSATVFLIRLSNRQREAHAPKAQYASITLLRLGIGRF
jgi:hypothetical protein